jgi:uncharacterized YigZ family protein
MFEDTFKTIETISEGIYKDKGSKFIAFAFPVVNEEQIKEHLQELRKKYFDARHHCYAYALGPNRDGYRINDDGEPSGTAGKPIFGQILSHDLTNILIVVIRYFGGVKLGVRGLINAYKASTIEALANNKIIERIITEVYELKFEYPLMNEVMRLLKENDLEQISHNFTLSCNIEFAVRRNDADRIKQLFEAIYGVSISYKYTR